MSEKSRRAQLNAVEGRFVRREIKGGRYYIGVLECQSRDALERTLTKLRAQGWRHIKTSGLSIMMEADL